MPNNFLTPKNLRWITVYLFLGLMVLLLALNLFAAPASGASSGTTPPQSNFVNCQQVLHLKCAYVIETATAKATKKATRTPKLSPTAEASPTPTHSPTPEASPTPAHSPTPTHSPTPSP